MGINHHRMYNLTDDKYNEIESLIRDAFDKNLESDHVKSLKGERTQDCFNVKKLGMIFNTMGNMVDLNS